MSEVAAARSTARGSSSGAPTFSVLTVVDPRSPQYLRECITSVHRQTLAAWEHLVVDDGTRSPETDTTLRIAAGRDNRIRPIRLPVAGGVVTALNRALAAATGDWIALLDQDDLLEPTALAAMAAAVGAQPTAVLGYSDWSRITARGRLIETFRKPAWSPERLAGQMYLRNLTVMRTDRVREVGGFRPGFEGAQDHDLALRVTEGGQEVLQVRESLYLWRSSASATGVDPAGTSAESGRRACQEHFERTGQEAIVRESALAGAFLIERIPKRGALASVIIPTRGTPAATLGRAPAPMVVNAVRSMMASPSRTPLEFVVVYDSAADLGYLDELRAIAGERLRLVEYAEPFNFSAKVNLGAVHASGDILILANDDIEITSPHWADQLVALVQQPDVGAAGALLHFEDGSLQHAGHTFTSGYATHAYLRVKDDPYGYFGDLLLEHEVAGVTAALIACRRDVYSEMGGFCVEFPGSYNDVDFNLKLRRAGYRIIVSPRVTAWHFESMTRDATPKPQESARLRSRWLRLMSEDPYLRV